MSGRSATAVMNTIGVHSLQMSTLSFQDSTKIAWTCTNCFGFAYTEKSKKETETPNFWTEELQNPKNYRVNFLFPVPYFLWKSINSKGTIVHIRPQGRVLISLSQAFDAKGGYATKSVQSIHCFQEIMLHNERTNEQNGTPYFLQHYRT